MSVCNTTNKLTDYDLAAGFLDDLEKVVGTTFALAQETGLNKELHIQEKLGEIIVQLETIKALLHTADLERSYKHLASQRAESIPLQTIKAYAFAYLDKSLTILKLSGGDDLRKYVKDPETAGDNRYKHKIFAQSLRFIGAGYGVFKEWSEQYEAADETLALAHYFKGMNVEKLNQRMSQFWAKIQ